VLLVWLCSAFLVGIVLGEAVAAPAEPALAAACGAACVLLWRPQGMLRLALLIAAAAALGAARIAMAAPVTSERSVWAYAGVDVVLVGYVARQPDRREDKQSAVIGAQQLLAGGVARAADGLVLVRLPPNPQLRYGQRVRVAGLLEVPPSDGDFDYRAYLERHGVRVLMTKPRVEALPGTAGAWWQRDLLWLNDRARATALRLIREPHASLLVGILLGVQSTIPAEVLQAFSATGTSHILVLSGWNISVLVSGVIAFLGALKLPRKRAALLCLPLIAVYVLFVGASPAVLRAALMGSLGVVAVLSDRESDAWTSLLAACAAMALLDPHVLWDIGFQLSALATGGLFAFARPIERLLTARGPLQHPLLNWSAEPLTATLAASVLSLPILLFHFGNLSLIAPLANVVMLWAVPFAMLLGCLAVVVGLLFLPLGQFLALLAWPFLTWLLEAARLLAQLPWAATTVPPIAAGWIWGYYALVIGGCLLKIKGRIDKLG